MTLQRRYSLIIPLLTFCCLLREYESTPSDSDLPTQKRIEFSCPTSEGLFPHPEQCDRYFECRNSHVTRHLCADGLVFDGKQSSISEDPCDHVQNTNHKCQGRPRLQRAKPGDANCPRQNGVYPSPNLGECGLFYSCLNGVGSSHQCAEGLHFEPKLGTCVWPRESTRDDCDSTAVNSRNSLDRRKSTTQRSKTHRSRDNSPDRRTVDGGFSCPGGGKLGIHSVHPHPRSCQMYYVCLNGEVPKEASCSNGLVFNRNTNKCDTTENVEGCGRTRQSSHTRRPHPQTENTYNSVMKKSAMTRHESSVDASTIEVDQFAKIVQILTHPAIQKILKPEIADTIARIQEKQNVMNNDELFSVIQNEVSIGSPRTQADSSVNRNDRRKYPRKINPEAFKNRASNDEYQPPSLHNSGRLPSLKNRRRNKFSSRFIPKIKKNIYEDEIAEKQNFTNHSHTPTVDENTNNEFDGLVKNQLHKEFKKQAKDILTTDEFSEFESEFSQFLKHFKLKRKQSKHANVASDTTPEVNYSVQSSTSTPSSVLSSTVSQTTSLSTERQPLRTTALITPTTRSQYGLAEPNGEENRGYELSTPFTVFTTTPEIISDITSSDSVQSSNTSSAVLADDREVTTENSRYQYIYYYDYVYEDGSQSGNKSKDFDEIDYVDGQSQAVGVSARETEHVDSTSGQNGSTLTTTHKPVIRVSTLESHKLVNVRIPNHDRVSPVVERPIQLPVLPSPRQATAPRLPLQSETARLLNSIRPDISDVDQQSASTFRRFPSFPPREILPFEDVKSEPSSSNVEHRPTDTFIYSDVERHPILPETHIRRQPDVKAQPQTVTPFTVFTSTRRPVDRSEAIPSNGPNRLSPIQASHASVQVEDPFAHAGQPNVAFPARFPLPADNPDARVVNRDHIFDRGQQFGLGHQDPKTVSKSLPLMQTVFRGQNFNAKPQHIKREIGAARSQANDDVSHFPAHPPKMRHVEDNIDCGVQTSLCRNRLIMSDYADQSSVQYPQPEFGGFQPVSKRMDHESYMRQGSLQPDVEYYYVYEDDDNFNVDDDVQYYYSDMPSQRDIHGATGKSRDDGPYASERFDEEGAYLADTRLRNSLEVDYDPPDETIVHNTEGSQSDIPSSVKRRRSYQYFEFGSDGQPLVRTVEGELTPDERRRLYLPTPSPARTSQDVASHVLSSEEDISKNVPEYSSW